MLMGFAANGDGSVERSGTALVSGLKVVF